ncbi:MAG: hypothetical protein IAE77_23105 [Prosthecobacter sp.]|jgi:KaiC/GvpD/RAD55 family RecA-like ATPase|uniref:hypothetical protein n=1 Tax=Prosthecobacter sp. TaxID=1965333 RepID=UPI0019FA42B1|nr:hypothetical protein [Prosthecobacter sp.]MBE2286363.1 hypothetical protein [Prosthecobacter sp.]
MKTKLQASGDELPGIKSFPSGIATLDALLSSRPDHDSSAGFAHHSAKGFMGVVFGASCAGKSILGLQLACRFVTHQEEPRLPTFAVFLTQESADVIKARAVDDFRFIAKSRFSTRLRDLKPAGGNGAGKVVVVEMPLEEQPQQEMLIEVFEYINSRFCCPHPTLRGTAVDDKQRILIVLDNAETIRRTAFARLIGGNIKTGSSLGDRRAFWKRLKAYCVRHRLRSWFCFEVEPAVGGRRNEEHKISTAPETYAADAVIRLGVNTHSSGFEERRLAIVKARDRYFRRGQHHYTIHAYRPPGAAVDKNGPFATPDRTNTGFIVYPSIPTQLHRMSREVGDRPARRADGSGCLGIAEIDHAVKLRNLDAKIGYLRPGTVSVIVSDLDSAGTDLALHFVAQRPRDWLYISFHHDRSMLAKIAGRYKATAGCQTALSSEEDVHCRYFPPEHISESKLLYDVDAAIRDVQSRNKGAIRVVVDDLFALDSRFPLLASRDNFVAALFELFRQRQVVSLVLDSVEVGEEKNPVEKSVPAGMADHVFVLRHITFQNRSCKAFSVLKLAEFVEPSIFWEISRDDVHARLKADASRFQFFKKLLSGHPEPVKITLSLYADSSDSPQHRNLELQRLILTSTFGQHIEVKLCHPQDYVLLQQTVGHAGLPVLGDCHIISVDEIWLEDLLRQELLVGFPHGTADPGEQPAHWDTINYVTAAHDLACERMLDCHPQRHHYAIPDRQNCGIIAYYPALVDQSFFVNAPVPQPGRRAPDWGQLIDLQNRYIESHCERHGFSSEYAPHNYLKMDAAFVKSQIQGPPVGGAFTFSMENRECCVSFLLELVLTQLTRRETLVTKERRLDPCLIGRWQMGLRTLFELLSPWDICRLADSWFRSSNDEPACLYSRQWFTSWGAIGTLCHGLEVLEFPKRTPPVSGTWYLAMLKGSSAIRAGKALIRRLTDPESELHRFNYGIAMPVNRDWYLDSQSLALVPTLPYAEALSAQADAIERVRRQQGFGKASFCEMLRKQRAVFHRTTISGYSNKVSPRLMGMIVKGARMLKKLRWNRDRAGSFPEAQLASIVAATFDELEQFPVES